MDRKEINIEEIMSQIRQEIREKGLTPDMLSFEDVPFDAAANTDAGEALKFLAAHCYVEPYRRLTGNPCKVFIQKVIRKLTKFYVEPIAAAQNAVNANTVQVLQSLCTEKMPGESLADRLEILELQNKELLGRLEKLEQENAQLRSRQS